MATRNKKSSEGKLAHADRPAKLSGNRRMGWNSDAIAEFAQRLDLKYMSLVPGASYRGFHDSIVNYLGNTNPQMVICMHEEHSVAIAHGYAKVAEKPMFVSVHSNVGLMHASMAIFNAWCDRVPMIIFGATGPVDADQRRPWIDWIHTARDQGALIRDFTKWDDQPASVPATIEAIARARQITMTAPNGPTYINLDAGLQEGKLTGEVEFPDMSRYEPAPPPAPSAESVAAAADLLVKAKKPVFLCGRVSRSQEDWDKRVELAEAIGAVVLTDMHNSSAFPTEHPLHVVEGRFRPADATKAVIEAADVILAYDWLDLAGFLTQCTGSPNVKAKVINCSVDMYIHRGWSMDYQALPAADLFMLSPPDAVTGPLLAAIDKKTKGARHKTPKMKIKLPKPPAPPKRGAKDGMSLREMASCVTEALAGKPVSYARVSLGWPGFASKFTGPMDYFGHDGGGGVGSGPGIAIGIALALMDSGRIPVAIVGDGDFMMGSNALWTAARFKIPLLMVVANNRSYYNDETHQERMAIVRGRPVENKWIGQRLDDPAVDLAGIARAQGIDSEGPIWELKDLPAALARGVKAVQAGKTYVIDVRIDPGYAEINMTTASRKKG